MPVTDHKDVKPIGFSSFCSVKFVNRRMLSGIPPYGLLFFLKSWFHIYEHHIESGQE